LPSQVRVAGGSNGSEDENDQQGPTLAERRLAPRPVNQPCQYEGRRANESRTDGIYRCDLEFVRARASVGREAGNGGCAKASLLAEQLGSDDEVAELLQKALIVGAPNARVDGFLSYVNKHPYAAGEISQSYRTRRVYASDGAMAGVDAQRLGQPVSYPRLQRRRAPGREALREGGLRWGLRWGVVG